MRALPILYAILTVLAAGLVPCVVLVRAPDTASEIDDPIAPPDGERDATLEVHVKDDAARPIDRAVVRAFVVGPKGATRDRIAPAPGGVARVEGLLRTTYWVVAEAEGHARASAMVVLESGVRRLELTAAPEHVLALEVRDEANRGVAGATVEVRSPADPVPIGATTDAEGHARVGRLGPGPFAVTVRAAGLGETSESRVDEGAPFRITLKKLGTLFVKVLDEGGAPARGARVLLSGPNLWPPRATETNEAGEAKVSGLDGAGYSARAVRGGSLSRLETGIAVGKGEERRVLLTLAPGRSVRVTVVEGEADDGPPVSGARVVLVEGGLSPFPIEAVTDKRGGAVVGPFLESGAIVTASADGLVARGAPLTDNAGAITLHLARAGTIEGRVVDGRGFPIDGVTLSLVGTDVGGGPVDEDPSRHAFRKAHFFATLSGPRALIPAGDLGVVPGPVPPIPRAGSLGEAAGLPVAAAASNAGVDTAAPWISKRDGTFVLAPATPGRVRVVARHPGYVEAESAFVVLAPGGKLEMTLTLARGGSLEGRVVDARGQAAPGVHVTAAGSDGSFERAARTAQDGSFAFASLPNAVTVLVAPADDPTEIVARAELRVGDSEKKELVLTMPPAREPIDVRVTDGRGRSIAGAQISARSDDARVGFSRTAFASKDGTATIARARGLGLRVEVSAPGFAPRTFAFADAPAEVRVELHEAERLEGRITDERGNGVADAALRLECGESIHGGRPRDASGNFTFSELPAGTCSLRVTAASFAPAELAITIREERGRRATETPRIELAREAVVEGDVVDDTGRPVAGARVALDRVPVVLAEGAPPPRMARTDERGRFRLGGLPEGALVLEAYAADVGRGQVENVRGDRGRTTGNVRITLAKLAPSEGDRSAGSVAVTLGQTKPPDVEVVIVHVAEGSEAERAGLRPDDTIESVNGVRVRTIEEARARLGGPLADDAVVGLRRDETRFVRRVPRERVRR